MGNKVFIDGFVYNIKSKENPYNVDEVVFDLKTKKIVSAKNDKTKYFKISCTVKGKKATNILNNLMDGDKVQFWGRLDINEEGKAYLVVDEIDFMNSFYDRYVDKDNDTENVHTKEDLSKLSEDDSGKIKAKKENGKLFLFRGW